MDTAAWPSVNGGFCCDQVVLSKADGTHSLIFWLLQYRPDTNSIAVAEGKGDLDQANPTFCLYDFSAQDFGFANGVELDFNEMVYSNEWLYVSSNVYNIASGAALGAVLWRMELDDFAGCNPVTTESMTDDDHQSFALTLGAGSTMYWGSQHGSLNKKIRIFRVADSSTDVNYNTKTIDSFPSSGRGEAVCTAPDGNDPCQRFDSRIVGAWTSNGQIGFMWTAAAGGGYEFPHVRVAIFATSDRSLISEPYIWNAENAWVYPSVGVNANGDVAGTVYKMGGGHNPKAYAFIWDDVSGDPAPWEVHSIRFSDDAPNDDEWGDYGRTHYYDNCRNTWLATVYALRGGGDEDDSEHRSVWFGRERDGCADLLIDSVGVFPFTLETGDFLLYGGVTWNIGSGTADASTTRFYLSTDEVQDAGDFLLTDVDSVPALAAGDDDNIITGETIGSGVASGTYYVIACADDLAVAAEITQTNNCLASTDTVEITRKFTFEIGDLSILDILSPPPFGSAGTGFIVADAVILIGARAPATNVRHWLDGDRFISDDAILLENVRWVPPFPLPIPDPIPIPRPLTSAQEQKASPSGPRTVLSPGEAKGGAVVIIPDQTPGGEYYVIACADASDRAPEPNEQNNCTASER